MPGAPHLDDTDKAIIDHLQHDGRISYARLGPMVGLSSAAVRQRVLSMIERGVVQVVAVTDPTTLGFDVQAWAGVRVSGDLDRTAEAIAAIDAVDYVVITAGRFDVMIEIVSEDKDHLLELMNEIRAIEGVVGVEMFTYLRLVKQTYNWGTR